MVRAPPTKEQVMVGIALITIGLAALGLAPMTFGNIIVFSLLTSTSVTTIILGLALIGKMPIKEILLGLFIGLLWFFLFALPFSLLPLPLEVRIMVLGFSTLVLVLALGWYERRKLAREKKRLHETPHS